MGVVGLARAAGIDSLEVDSASGIPIGLSRDNHSALPPHRSIHWNSFYHPKSYISVEAVQDSLLPVERHCARGVYCSRTGIGVNMELKGRTALEERERLVLTNVKCGRSVPV